MLSYHKVWLAAHPERSAQWLLERFADGFDIHHVDGDRTNESPDNLALIEHHDHMRLHGLDMRRGIYQRAERAERVPPALAEKTDHAAGELMYERRAAGERWTRIAFDLYGSRYDARPQLLAKEYAVASNRPWPIAVVIPYDQDRKLRVNDVATRHLAY